MLSPMIVSRTDLPILKELEEKGTKHFLGEHRDFRNHETLKNFLQNETNVSFSWTHLKPGERLEIHTHPVKSMIIVCKGEGYLEGDINQEIKEGDVVNVPPFARHGFLGGEKNGFHALSVQFEDRSLYAHGVDPKVSFLKENQIREEILQYNKNKIDLYLALPLFQEMKMNVLNDSSSLNTLFSFLKTWSLDFQKLIMLRFITSSSSPFKEIAKEHLCDEYGHDTLLAQQKGMDDPILKALSTWFIHQMMVRNDIEKQILVHLVLEGAACAFHQFCSDHLPLKDNSYIKVHAIHDEDHSEMGLDLVIHHYKNDKEQVLKTLDEGWNMFTLMFIRCHELIFGKK